MGDAGGFLRYSSGRSGAFVLAQRCWGGGLWTVRSLFMMGPRDRGRKRLSRVELLPEPGSEFTVQNHGSESRRSPGQRLGGERSPGSLTIRVVHRFSLLSFQPGRASALIPVA